MRFILAPLMLSLTGCATLATHPIQPIEWVKLDTRAELAEACAKYVGDSPARAKAVPNLRRVVDHATLGCFKRNADRCTVYSLRPRTPHAHDAEREADLGAEVRHCFEGRFH